MHSQVVVKFLGLLCFLLLPCFSSFAQNRQSPCDSSAYSESLPVFPGGDKVLFKLLTDSLRYPETAQKDRVGGKVVVSYVVDTTGEVTQIEVAAGVREDIDKEAVRLVALLPAYAPAVQNCKKVSVRYRIPIYFYPDKRWKRRFKKGKIVSGASLK